MVAAAVAACGLARAEKLTVRLDFQPVGFHSAMHLAKEKGWFQREGLEVEIEDGAGSTNTVQLVGAGHFDVGQVVLGVMASARAKGLPVKSFAGFLRKGDLAVMVPQGSSIKTIADLKGKKIVCFAGSAWVPFIDAFLAKGNLDRTTVDVQMVSPPTMYSLYSAGVADGFMSVEFMKTVVEKQRPTHSIRLADFGINYPSYGLMATDKNIAERRDALAKLAKVQIETWEYIWKGNVDEAVQALLKARADKKLDFAIMKDQLELTRVLFDTEETKGKRIGWQSSKDWADSLRSMKDAGAIGPSNTNPDDYFTNALLPR
jgi:NitT/TauT family transport system substrate-binding protein